MKNSTSMNRRFFIGSALLGAGALVAGCSSQQKPTDQTTALPDVQVTDGKVLLHTFPTVTKDQVELGSKEIDTSGAEYQAETYNEVHHRHDIRNVQFLTADASATAFVVGSTLDAEYKDDVEAFRKSYFFKPTPEYRKVRNTDVLAQPARVVNIAWANAFDTNGSISQSAQIFFQPLGSVVLNNLGFGPVTNKAIVATYVIEDRFITDSFDEVVANYHIMDRATMNGMKLQCPPTFRVVAGAGQLSVDGSFEQYVVTTARYINGYLP